MAFAADPSPAAGDPEERGPVIARVKVARNGEGFLLDGAAEAGFSRHLLSFIARRRRTRARAGEIVARPTAFLKAIARHPSEDLTPSAVFAEQSNTSVVFGNRLILKLFRRLQEGVNPDLQIGRYLTENGFAHTPPVAGFIEYRAAGGKSKTLGILQGYVANQGDAWEFTLNMLDGYFEQVAARQPGLAEAPVPRESLLETTGRDIPEEMAVLAGFYLSAVRKLGERTAQMHLTLARPTRDTAMAPENFSRLYQRSLYQSMRTTCRRNLSLLRRHLGRLPEDVRAEAAGLAEKEKAILDAFRRLVDIPITARRTRCHGDYHLGQVLYTGKDFVIIDFEGEPERPLSERLIKRSPLRDVAGMLRSFHYAAVTALRSAETRGWMRPEHRSALASWGEYWFKWVGAAFLAEYLRVAGAGDFLPPSDAQKQVLLDGFVLEKAIYELGYELNNRPAWVRIPIHGIHSVLQGIENQ
jgi:maltose alpha-D-glucosyltransferase/alpha-amylase